MVLSISTYSKSASSDKTLNTCSKTPFLAHLRKRWKTKFQCPKDSGKSRHGASVRAIHSTASRNNRLSWAWRPGSPGLPGSKGANRSHYASLSTVQSIRSSPGASGLNQSLGTLFSDPSGSDLVWIDIK